MKKTLIAMTLAALPVASMAEVVLYGQIKGGVETTKVKGVKGTTTQIVDYGSRIGFKGQEQLNNSLKAIWQLEQKVNIGGGDSKANVITYTRNSDGTITTSAGSVKQASGFGTRDSFIGLEGGFGKVKVGYFGDPVHNVNGDLDQWEYSSDAAGLGIFTRANDAVNRRVAVGYQTPDMAGFTAKAYVSPSDNNKQTADANNNDNRTADRAVYGLGASYKNSGFFADLAGTYVKNGANNAELKKDSTWKKKHAYQAIAQVGYDANNWLVGVAYQVGRNVDKAMEMGEDTSGNMQYHRVARSQEVATSVAYTIDNALTLKGSAAYGFNLKGYNTSGTVADGTALVKTFGNGKYIQGILGADYNLSKRTTLNGQVGYLQFGKKDYNKREGTIGVGLKHKF